MARFTAPLSDRMKKLLADPEKKREIDSKETPSERFECIKEMLNNE